MSGNPVEQDELFAGSQRTREAAASRASAQRHRRLRYLYFGLASGWGFVAGSVAVLAALDALGQTVPLGGGLGATLAVAGALALVGGIVVSLAYREAVRRG